MKVGAGSLGGLGGRKLLLFSRVASPSDDKYVVFCAAAPWVSSCHSYALYSSCDQRILGGVVSVVGLWLSVCALGSVMLPGVLVKLGVGAIVLDEADPCVELDG